MLVSVTKCKWDLYHYYGSCKSQTRTSQLNAEFFILQSASLEIKPGHAELNVTYFLVIVRKKTH
jgi:hypothetical protein